MKPLQLSAILACLCLALAPDVASAHGRGTFSFGISVGSPPCYRPCFAPPFWGFHYVRPYPVYVAPRPVIVEPVPVVVQPAVVQPAPVVLQPAPAVRSAPANTVEPVRLVSSSSVDSHLQLLTHPDERVRAEAVMELGRVKAETAVDSVAATLAGDRSPIVRESAARALGLIASPRGLPALTRAAQADNDRDVRRSAQFAVEIIHANLRRN